MSARRFGLPVAMVLYSFLGIAVTSASTVVFGKPIWNPVELLGRFHQPLLAFLGLIALLVATLNVNIGANVVGPSNDFSNLAPRYISFRMGGLITGLLGLLMMPWYWLSTLRQLLFGWLVGYSGLLGPVAGIMVADYFLMRRRQLDTYSLYRRGGIYEYRNGFNPLRNDRARSAVWWLRWSAGSCRRLQFLLRIRMVRRVLLPAEFTIC